MARQTVHRWVARYRQSGIDGLADRSHAPKAHPWRVSAEIEAVICELRTSHRRWGPRRLVFELARRGYPRVSRSAVYRVLVRHRLLEHRTTTLRYRQASHEATAASRPGPPRKLTGRDLTRGGPDMYFPNGKHMTEEPQ